MRTMGPALGIIQSRASMASGMSIKPKTEAEGGCGVIGAASSEQIPGRHLLPALARMRNRGNGKGGGIAALGLSADRLGVSKTVLQRDYLVQIAYLEPSVRTEVENEFIFPFLQVDSTGLVEALPDYRSVEGLVVKPPEVRRYFCRVKDDVLKEFMAKNLLDGPELAEDEFIYQNSYRLNRKFYASLGEKKAFVLSHGKDMMVLKIVGYGDQVIRYYKLEDFPAHIWIGHHRYPTKGRVWHPGGAHPFVGLHEALVHNGDFSNYYSISEYLAQRNIFPLFLTDTEVAVYLFDLWRRVYRYPMEYLIEALAPTTERDFHVLPEEKRRVYREIQATHIHGSPDGPWFFIVGRSERDGRELHLVGITDTSMLRPQVFALQEDKSKIGLIASEGQAIDAFLRSLAAEDSRFAAKADIYWNARGGSHTDGGAFIFTIDRTAETPQLVCTDKFGRQVVAPPRGSTKKTVERVLEFASKRPGMEGLLTTVQGSSSLADLCIDLEKEAKTSLHGRTAAVELLTWLLDNLHLVPYGREGVNRAAIESCLFQILRGFPLISEIPSPSWALIDLASMEHLRQPVGSERTLLLDVRDFPAEGENSASSLIVKAYRRGWKRVLSFDWCGQRFCGCGLGPHSEGFRIDVFGNPGDYLGSGLDGAEIYVHTSAQDQVAQIMKSGKLVVYGDVGQTFMYASKGGEAYVLGNAAGRPLINAVGRPRVVINGTCLDYLAESFMAGDPLNGGGFVVLNGIKFDHEGQMHELPTPYPGGNLFSLSSGGAIYLRDPEQLVGEDQLNGGRLTKLGQRDWNVIRPYLEENERLFGIRVEDGLLRKGELPLDWSETYRKIEAVQLEALTMAEG
jgi:glutamate synthase domain-containing protein 1/glutamate synthase domain-containing protein 3